MSTNTNAPLHPPDFAADLSGATQALAAGLPDPATLKRLANEFFQEESSASHIPASIFNGLGLETIGPDTIGQNLPNLLPTPRPPDFPSQIFPEDRLIAPSGTDFPGVPPFGFLEQIRSPFSDPTWPATPIPEIPGLPTVKIPTETTIHSFQSSLSEQPLAKIPATPAPAVLAPQLPGVGHRMGDIGSPAPFQFLETARSISVSPVLEPYNPPAALPQQIAAPDGVFDVQAIRRDFPILQEKVNGKPLIWLDNAATTQKPRAVIDRLTYFYEHENSNVHRAAHTLAARSTDAFDGAREKVRRFLNAATSREIIFVRGATEGINLVANTWGKKNIGAGDEIVLTHLEHHANIVPWQMLAAEKGAKLLVVPVDDHGQLLLDKFETLLSSKTKLVAFTHVSNALGTVTPVQEIIAAAQRRGIVTLVDGSQGVSHMKVDVQALGADFYVFSGHKLFAPTGIGVVYGKLDLLETLPPWQGGGNMIVDVSFEKTIYHPAPFRFEAGTGSIADAVGLGAAIDYLEQLGMHNIGRYEHQLLEYATGLLRQVPGLRLIGTAKNKASVLSFVLEGFTNDEIGQYLNREGIAVRTGHHCAQPILRRFGLESTVRPSLAFYNTCEEVDALVAAVWNLKNGRRTGL